MPEYSASSFNQDKQHSKAMLAAIITGEAAYQSGSATIDTSKSKSESSRKDNASIFNTDSFSSTKALPKDKFSRPSFSSSSSNGSKDQ